MAEKQMQNWISNQLQAVHKTPHTCLPLGAWVTATSQTHAPHLRKRSSVQQPKSVHMLATCRMHPHCQNSAPTTAHCIQCPCYPPPTSHAHVAALTLTAAFKPSQPLSARMSFTLPCPTANAHMHTNADCSNLQQHSWRCSHTTLPHPTASARMHTRPLGHHTHTGVHVDAHTQRWPVKVDSQTRGLWTTLLY